ncbi:helix-turn-helix transcriptional regulator [Streptomyces sp. F8]|uniref:TOBE domain-containing protein n=1 Tax=Streptomyces sp. F8 TaxID=1436085 RepID=UPI0029CE6834|nr:helix-turn-helix transcriptional regulator [Streptomyces sp. F8]MDX6764696.1 helix-turn-helix transcriptional regulator [Streptomyces sp. F8]
MQSYTIGQAARLLGVSPDTARRWADAGRVVTHRDEVGRRLINGRDLAAFSVEVGQGAHAEDAEPYTSARNAFPGIVAFSVEVGQGAHAEDAEPYTSARNAFPGIVTAVRLGDVCSQVDIQAGPHRLVSLLTREAAEELGLEVGMRATARVKSTSVHVDRA